MIKVVWLGTPQMESQNISKLLKALGYTPYEMIDLIRNEGHLDEWRAAMLNQKPLDTSFLKDYDALLLSPASMFYQEILENNRSVKFIYQDLDSTTAYKRYNRIQQLVKINAIWANLFSRTRRIINFIKLDLRHAVKGHQDSLAFQIFYKQQFNEYKSNIPESKLLIYSSQDGWKPICDFLEKTIPTIKLPLGQTSPKINVNKNVWELAVKNLRANLVVISLYFLTLISIFIYLIFFY